MEEQYKWTNTLFKEMGYNNIRISGDIKNKSTSNNSLRIHYELNFRKCHNMKMLLQYLSKLKIKIAKVPKISCVLWETSTRK